MALECATCGRIFDQRETGALFLTECSPVHVGDPPEIYHFCTYKCVRVWCE